MTASGRVHPFISNRLTPISRNSARLKPITVALAYTRAGRRTAYDSAYARCLEPPCPFEVEMMDWCRGWPGPLPSRTSVA
jgi:hypothetical protein